MKILFAVPKNKSLFGDKGMTAHPHIGIAYLSAFLKKHNIEVKIFDHGLVDDLKELYSMIDKFKPDLIGVTIFSYSYGLAYSLIEAIRQKTSIPIVVGGPHICAIGNKILEDAKIGFAVKQEGEFTLLELLKELEKKSSDFAGILGLIWRNRQGTTIENPDRELIADLDALPFPEYDAFNIEKYVCYKHKLLPLITSRGCPFGCNYCSVRLSMGQRFRPRSAENVFAEIKHFYELGFNSFDINDDCFTLDNQRAMRICDLIIDHNLNIRFQLYNGIRVDTVNPLLLKKIKRAGCFFISYGCEAGNDRVLKAIKKGITLRQVEEAVKWTNAAGIRNSVNFIIGHKEETYQDAQDTLNFAARLPTNFVNFYNLLPYPGTDSYAWARPHARFLVPPESFLENISYRDNQPIYETDEFTERQRQEVIAKGFDLYRKKILIFRLGKILGSLIYWATKNNWVNKTTTHFALNNQLGRFIYMRLARKSFQT
jgi:radical SAM superfamily enzyme YgiQ (UPF0313 family)